MAEPVVELVQEATPEILEGLHRLVPQLSKSAAPMTLAELTEIVGAPATPFFIARVDGRIVGSLTLVVFRLPTGVRAWIEDVVVDEAARGHGVGAALNTAAIAHALERGSRTIDLTSRPSREAANRLYQRLGFVARDTNVYRYEG
jgi:ribosomal protein S18 acetylase RimI-like enzyme